MPEHEHILPISYGRKRSPEVHIFMNYSHGCLTNQHPIEYHCLSVLTCHVNELYISVHSYTYELYGMWKIMK